MLNIDVTCTGRGGLFSRARFSVTLTNSRNGNKLEALNLTRKRVDEEVSRIAIAALAAGHAFTVTVDGQPAPTVATY